MPVISRTVACAAILAAAATGLLGAPRQAVSETLREAVELAISTHPTVRRAEALTSEANARIDEARSTYFPTIDIAGAAGPEFSDNGATRLLQASKGKSNDYNILTRQEASISLRQLVFDGFGRENRVEAARILSGAARMELQNAQEEIGLRAVEAFLDVLRNRELLALSQDNVQSHRRFLDQTRQRATTGVGPRIDISQAESRLALAESRLIQVQGALRSAEARYLESVGQAPGSLRVPQTPVSAVPSTPDQATAVAYSNSPAVKAASETVRARRTELAAQDGSFWPEVSIDGQVGIDNNVDGSPQHSKEALALVRGRYNIFSGGRDTARSQQAAARISQSIEREGEVRRQVEQNVRLAFAALESARLRVPPLQVTVDTAAQVVNGYQRQFELGRRTLQDVLDAENELYQNRTNLLNAQYAFAFANYQALAAMGSLVGTARGAGGAPTAMISTPPAEVPLPQVGGRAPAPGPVTTSPLPQPGAAPAAEDFSAAPAQPRGRRAAATAPAMARGATGGVWAVQVGAFSSAANAERAAQRLRGQGFAVEVVSGGGLSKVQLRGFPSRNAAQAAASEVRSKTGGQASVVRN